MMQLIMLDMDPQRHVKYRRIVQRGFTPRMVSAMEKPIREQARRIVDEISERDECEFVKEVVAERLIGFEDPEFQTSREDAQRASAEAFIDGIKEIPVRFTPQRRGAGRAA